MRHHSHKFLVWPYKLAHWQSVNKVLFYAEVYEHLPSAYHIHISRNGSQDKSEHSSACKMNGIKIDTLYDTKWVTCYAVALRPNIERKAQR